MKDTGKIFVPYSQYYQYLDHETWGTTYRNRIFYSGSPGLVYTGLDSNNTPATGEAISRYRIGTGSSGNGNGYTSAFDGTTLLGIPKYYDNDDAYPVTVIGSHAFSGNTTIERVTIPDSVERIQDYAFYGCRGIKFIIMDRNTPPVIDANTFEDNSADRIFVVPDSESNAIRNDYINAEHWSKYAALIITKSEYAKMSTGSGFTHFVINKTTSGEFDVSLNITKYDATQMTIIWGDGKSDVITDLGGETSPYSGSVRHTYFPGNYTLSIIARGFWKIQYGFQLLGGTVPNGYLTEVHLDANFAARSYGDANYNETIDFDGLFAGCSNVKVLSLPNTIHYLMPNVLAGMSSLETLQLPFVGEKPSPETDRNGSLGYLFGDRTFGDAVVVEHMFNGTESGQFYIPKNLKNLTILMGTLKNGSLSNITSLETVNLPVVIAAINPYTFKGCENLTNINITDVIKSIGNNAFDGCSKLLMENIPATLTTISDYAFNGCESITVGSIPSTIESIGSYGFAGCSNITIASLPDGLNSIGEGAFQGCSKIELFALPDAITTLPAYCFDGCSEVTFTTLPPEMTEIPNYVYRGCSKVTFSQFIPNTTSIGEGAFDGCTNVTFGELPAQVETIGAHAFYECGKIKFEFLPDDISSIGAFAFYKCVNCTFSTIPMGMGRIEEGSFSFCSNATISYIPGSIRSIGPRAFAGCSNLMITALPNNITIGEYAFENCTSMTLSSIPTSLTVIEEGVFSGCSKIAMTYIPASVTKIKSKAFKGCTSLDTIDFGHRGASTQIATGSSDIASDAFIDTHISRFTFYHAHGNTYSPPAYDSASPYGAPSSAEVIVLLAVDPISGNTLASYLTCTSDVRGESEVVYYITGVTELFKEYITERGMFNIGTTFAPNTSTDAGYIVGVRKGAFNGVDNFPVNASINFADECQLTVIAEEAFMGNTKLTSIHLPNNLMDIEDHAFDGCTAMNLTQLPADIKNIGSYAFKGCSQVSFSTIPTYIQTIGTGAFDGCTAITNLKLNTCNELKSMDASSPQSTISEIALPNRGFTMVSFKIPNEEYVFICHFRAIESERYTVFNAATGTDEGFRAFVHKNRLFVGNILIYDGIQLNTDYMITIRGTTQDGPVMNSLIFTINDMEYNRFNFGYNHPGDGAYGIDGFELSQTGATIINMAYYKGNLNEQIIANKLKGFLNGTTVTLFTLPDFSGYTSYTMRTDFDTVASIADYKNSDRFNAVGWAQICAIGREGVIVAKDATTGDKLHASTMTNLTASTMYKSCIGVPNAEGDIDVWFQCGECKEVIMKYPPGSSFSSCPKDGANISETDSAMWFEIIGFYTDKSVHYGDCPITIGMKYLLPEKSQLYSASHGMKDCMFGPKKDGSSGTPNGTYHEYTGTEDNGMVWLVANDTTCVSSIKIVNGSTTEGFNFNSTTTTNYANLPLTTRFGGNPSKDATYNINVEPNEAGTAYFNPSHAVNAHLITGNFYNAIVNSANPRSIYFDAHFGEITRDEASECIVLTRGAKIGIPVRSGDKVTVTYYNSWNLTGWRDCIARARGNTDHFEALPSILKYITEDVVKFTNIGGLHKVINETHDKLFLYSLSEAGMYNATDPYMYEGKAFQFYQPSVASNGGRTAVRRKFLINDPSNYTYWWLRTPNMLVSWYPGFLGLTIRSDGYLNHNNRIGMDTSYGVCFGLSTKSRNQNRQETIAKQVESSQAISVTASGACDPNAGMTHVMDFTITDKNLADAGDAPRIDMRYKIDAGNLAGGYAITSSAGGIFCGGVKILDASKYANGDKITIIIRQPKANEIATGDKKQLLVFVNNTQAATPINFDKFTLTADKFGINARAKSNDDRLVMVGTDNGTVDNIDIINQELTDDELKALPACRYLKFS